MMSLIEGKSIKKLSFATTRILFSGQVITSVRNVVKELIENSLDASSRNIDVKLVESGLSKIEVRDDGIGVCVQDVATMCKAHFTSKVSGEEAIGECDTYGFRGEALAAMCAVSDVYVTTKTSSEELSTTYVFNSNGSLVEQKLSSLGQGTSVCCLNLFKNLPVRRKMWNSFRRKKDDLRQCEDLVKFYSVLHPDVGFSLSIENCLVWKKTPVSDVRSALVQAWGISTLQQMEEHSAQDHKSQVQLQAFLPKYGANSQVVCKKSADACWTAVNKKPVKQKEITKILHQSFGSQWGKGCYPVCFIHLVLDKRQLDVNLEPDKGLVLIHPKEAVLEMVRKVVAKACEKGDCSPATPLPPSPSLCHSTSAEASPHVAAAGARNPDASLQKGSHYTRPNSEEKEERSVHPSNCTQNDMLTSLPLTPEIEQPNLPEKVKETWNSSLEERLFDDKLNGRASNKGSDQIQASKSRTISSSDIESLVSKPANNNLFVPVNLDDKTLPEVVGQPTRAEPVDRSVYHSHVNSKASASRMSISSNVNRDFRNCNEESLAIGDASKSTNGNVSDDSILSSLSDDCILIDSVKEGNESTVLLSNTSSVEGPSKISSAKWTLGQLCSDSGNIQPVKLLVGGGGGGGRCEKRKSSLSPAGSHSKKAKAERGQGKLDVLIASQVVRNPKTAFAYFCKDYRAKVVSGNPNAKLSEITNILVKMFEELEPEKKETYKRMTGDKITSSLGCQRTKPDFPAGPSESSKPVSSKPKDDLVRKEMFLDFNYSVLKNCIQHQDTNGSSSALSLVGALEGSRCWIGLEGEGRLVTLNHFRMKEAVIYHELKCTYRLKQEPLPVPIVLTEKSFECGKLFKVLLDLSARKEFGSYLEISDTRITANGFKILRMQNGDQVEMAGLNQDLPFYGVNDLKEILQAIQSGHSTLALCRPQKVQHFLKGEAVRMVRLMTPKLTESEMRELLKSCLLLPEEYKTCVHNKPFTDVINFVNSIQL